MKSIYEQDYLQQLKEPGQTYYQYSRFCDLFNNWLKSHTGYCSVTTIPCNPGDYLELDFSGDLLRWRDYTGNMHIGHVFVASLRYSKLMYAEVFENEATESWITGAVHALTWIGAKPRAVTIDNARALVNKSDPHLGELSAALSNMCAYYGIMAQTCPVRRASYKQSVEFSVYMVQKGPQRKLVGETEVAYTPDLKALNTRLLELTEEDNSAPWKSDRPGSRHICYESHEQKCMQPLPLMPYRVCKWTSVTASKSYLVKVDGHAWMVDWKEAGKRVAVAISDTEVRFYSMTDFRLVGCYKRDFGEYRTHTDPKLMSPADLAFRGGYEGVAEDFEASGFATDAILGFLRGLFNNDRYPQMTKHNIVQGLKGLCRKHGVKLVDSACRWAVASQCPDDYQAIRGRVKTEIASINAHRRNNRALKGGK